MMHMSLTCMSGKLFNMLVDWHANLDASSFSVDRIPLACAAAIQNQPWLYLIVSADDIVISGFRST